MAIRTNYVAGEERTASQVNEENTQILANQTNIANIVYDRRLFSTGTIVDIDTTTTETQLLSVSVPGGTLGTSNIIAGRLWIGDFRPGNSSYFTIRVKYDGQVLSLTANSLIHTDYEKGFVDFEIFAKNNTNLQKASGYLTIVRSQTLHNAVGYMITDVRFVDMTVDSTQDKNLVVTGQWGSNESFFHMEAARITMLRG